jgi:hypothetical protein
MGRVETVARLDTPTAPGELFAAIESLDGYEKWLDIVDRVVPAEPSEGDPGPAWRVDLRAQIGPLRRSKRLRMVRDLHDAPGRVRYVRRETDGREHSPWRLSAQVAPAADGGSRLEMSLYYGGTLWVPMIERLLRDEIERSRPRLLAHLSGS